MYAHKKSPYKNCNEQIPLPFGTIYSNLSHYKDSVKFRIGKQNDLFSKKKIVPF